VAQFFGDLPAEFATMSTTVWLGAESVVACLYANGYAFLFDLEQNKYCKGYATDPQGRIVDTARLLAGTRKFRLPPLTLDFPAAPAVSSQVDDQGVFLEPQPRPYLSWKGLPGDWKIVLSMSSEGTYDGDRAPHDEVWLFDRERQWLAFVYPSLPLPEQGKTEEGLYFARGFDLRAGRALCGSAGAYWMSRPAYEDWKSKGFIGGKDAAKTQPR
jgi:hypothetical protein